MALTVYEIRSAKAEGYVAFVHKNVVGDNPYHENDARHWAWMEGWIKAAIDIANEKPKGE